MPGFNINGQGQAAGATAPSNLTETRRKHRWIFEQIGPNLVPTGTLVMLQNAQRPKFSLEEPVMEHNQEKVYFAGKQTWETVTLTWYDGEQNPDVSGDIYFWLENVVNIDTLVVSDPSFYKRNAKLYMLDGAGSPSETWIMYGCWPKEVNWGDLSYTETEIATIEVQMRYDRAVRRPGQA